MTRRPAPRDLALPGGLAVLTVVELVSLGVADTVALPLSILSVLLLGLRRIWPLASGTAVLAVIGIVPFFGPEVDEPATPLVVLGVATYTMGRRIADHRGLVPLVAFILLLLFDLSDTSSFGFEISNVVFICLLAASPYVAGRGARALSARNDRLREQAAELIRLQDEVRREAAAAERGRIARELHDVIAHSVSAMVVQAAAAEELVRSDPERAQLATREVATTGRRALAETGRLLHLLRDEGDELGLAPSVGLSQLGDLADAVRRGGLDVELEVDGSLTDLPAGVDLSAYRLVQEALTNALKHGAGSARVRLRRDAMRLRLDVSNPVGERTRGVAGSGLGLVGMAERVSVFGGTLRHGARDDGQWELSAELPLDVET